MIYSIIIPTYNRYDKLQSVLSALESQSFNKNDFEVIIVNDGSTQVEYNHLCGQLIKFSFNAKYLIQENKGAAAARNLGIDNATGEYVLFIGDDTYPNHNLLSEHYMTHQSVNEDIVVLGFVDWEKSLELNDLMKFISPNGPQFDFRIKDIKNAGYRRFYTSNISIPTHILKNEKFYEGFPLCNLEDIELGYRLEKKGYKVYYNHNAVVYHDHYYEDDDLFIRRQESVGRNKKILLNLHPELNNLWSNRLFLLIIILKNNVFIKIGLLFKIRKLYLSSLFENAAIKSFLRSK